MGAKERDGVGELSITAHHDIPVSDSKGYVSLKSLFLMVPNLYKHWLAYEHHEHQLNCFFCVLGNPGL
jgi:hypothetical protein